MKTLVACLLGVVMLAGCSGDVDVHGIPEKIELAVPFCVPAPKDAGAE